MADVGCCWVYSPQSPGAPTTGLGAEGPFIDLPPRHTCTGWHLSVRLSTWWIRYLFRLRNQSDMHRVPVLRVPPNATSRFGHHLPAVLPEPGWGGTVPPLPQVPDRLEVEQRVSEAKVVRVGCAAALLLGFGLAAGCTAGRGVRTELGMAQPGEALGAVGELMTARDRERLATIAAERE